MAYAKYTPCANCPFRTDIPGYLHGERAKEIAEAIQDDGTFPCHKTLDYSDTGDDEDDEPRRTEGTKECAGARFVRDKEQGPSQLDRIMGRIGAYDPDKITKTVPMTASYTAFIEHHGGVVHDTCAIVGDGCLEPAGWGGFGAPKTNLMADPEHMTTCVHCGESVCTNCMDDGDPTICQDCAGEDD